MADDEEEREIDISQFPHWSRNWYHTAPNLTSVSPPPRLSIFDPSYKPALDQDDYPLPSYNTAPSQHTSLREYYLPWSSDPLESGTPVNAGTKEERIRMLEREFGQNAKPPPKDAFTDENGNPLVGTVDTKGNLVTVGPKKRAAFRALQILFALVAAVPSIYAALFIKPHQGTPPPAGKLAAFVLYALSVITTLGMLYLHFLRPCCGGRGKAERDNPILNGMMVLPVQSLPGGKGEKKKKRNDKARGKVPGNDVQVNLIVDPNAFGIGDKGDDGDDEDEDGEAWGSDRDPPFPGSAKGKKRGKARRRSLFAGLAMEQEWKRARAWAKKMTLVDAAGLVLWGATFVLILLGKRCPSGGYSGWCNAYNTSSAAACFLCLAFGASVFFDIKDLYDSKMNPRTRT